MNILLAEDHPVYRKGIRQIIEERENLTLVGETGHGIEALELARKLKPDLAVLDVGLPGMGGLDIARARLKEHLDFEILFLTMYKDREIFDEAVTLGVQGYVLKESTHEEIAEAIMAVAEGRSWFSPSLAEFVVDRASGARKLRKKVPGLDALSKAERRILKLIASNLTTKEIAEMIGISPRTVENHRAHMCTKLDLQGSHSLLKFAFDHRSKL